MGVRVGKGPILGFLELFPFTLPPTVKLYGLCPLILLLHLPPPSPATPAKLPASGSLS
jgi:hypothetical protein